MARLAILAAAAAVVAVARAQSNPDQIVNLPGAPALNFSQYAGYLTVDQAAGRNLFYWHAESQGNPSTDPLVLWLNGGPGCSSLGGHFTENGPFIVNSDGATLSPNPYAWNRVANMIWLEAPAGVGFSYSNTPADYTTGDVRTANDNLQALLQFFAKFPAYQGRQFFISGESYAGHYIPELAYAIITYNAGVPAAQQINLAGILVGNGLTDENIDFSSNPPYWMNHALVSPWAYQTAYTACANGTLFAACSGYLVSPPCPDACNNALTVLGNQIGNINPYNIYQDLCLTGQGVDAAAGPTKPGSMRPFRHVAGSGTVKGVNQAYVMLRNHPLFQRILSQKVKKATGEEAVVAAGWKEGQGIYPAVPALDDRLADSPFVPCIDEYVATYLNRADVKAAIHANASITWTDCNQNTLNYNFNHSSMLPIYDMMATAAPSVRVLIYSGDADSVLPFLGTEWNVQALGRTITKDWAEWTGSDQQPAGYSISLTHAPGNDMRYATIKAAGHMVPAIGAHGLDFFSRFIANQPF